MANFNPLQTWFNSFGLDRSGHPSLKLSLNLIRESFMQARRAVEPDLPQLAEVSNLTIGPEPHRLNSRLYVPMAAEQNAGPGILFFHGGGFVLGDLDSHDVICRRLADSARCRLLAIDYRRAPTHKFPAAHDDAMMAWTWLLEHGETIGFKPEKLAVAGDSAGGNLAAFLAQQTLKRGLQAPAFQLLLYPLLQFSDIRTKPRRWQEGGMFLSPQLFDYFRDAYVADPADRMDERVSPLFAAPDNFRALCPAHLVLCGWDPLKDEGFAYADKLAAHGIAVTVREHADMVHGFMNLTGVSTSARDAIREAGLKIAAAFGTHSKP